MKLHHIGVVVKDIVSAAAWWRDVCGYHQEGQLVHDPVQKVTVQLWRGSDGVCVELIAPAGEDSRVAAFLKERGGGLYHLCYEVDDLDAVLAALRKVGAFPVTKAEPAVAFGGKRVVFLVSPQRVMMELLEEART